MKRLRLNLALMVAFFFGLFLFLYGSYIFHYELISLFVVMLVCVLMGLDLITRKIPGISRNLLYLIGAIFYFAWLLFYNEFDPIQSIQNVYRFFTEIFILTLGLNISSHLSKFLDETSDILEQVSFSRLKPALRLEEISSDIQKEVSRSIRYERPLSLLVIDVTKDLASEKTEDHLTFLQSEMMENYFEARISHELMKLTRSADIVVKLDLLGQFLILCPESERRSVEFLGERISLQIDEMFDRRTNWGIAELSAENDTFELLKKAAEMDMENRSLNVGVVFKGESELSEFMKDYKNMTHPEINEKGEMS